MRQQQQEPNLLGDVQKSANIALWLFQTIALVADVWCRRPGTWGVKHANGQMALSLLAVLMVPVFFPKQPPLGLAAFFCATAVLLVFHRIKGIQLRYRGYETHSRYTGDSRFSPFPTSDQIKAKVFCEPMFVLVAGCMLLPFSNPLGTYLLVVSFCHFFIQAWMEQEVKARERRYKDAMFEAGMIGQYDQ